MLQEHISFKWEESGPEEQTFIKIKELLMDEDNLLIRPDFTKLFILQTDASTLGLGAILSQEIDGKDKPIAYASCQTSQTEAKYGATQLETLAVVWAMKHFRHYLAGALFRLIIDHAALSSLLNVE